VNLVLGSLGGKQLIDIIIEKKMNQTSKSSKEATTPSQRSSLWKRIGRRGSKSPSQPPRTPPGAAIPLKPIRGEAAVEADVGDARGKRSEGRNSKSNGKGGLIRKLKSPFRNTPNNFSLESDDGNLVVVTEHKRYTKSARPNSPAYSTDSYATVEVGLSLVKPIDAQA
jgi:hypothetical protein